MKDLKRLLPYLKRYKNRLYLGFVFVTISNISSTYLPRIVGETIDHISKSSIQQDYVMYQIALILGLTILSGFFMFLTRQTIIYASRLIEYDLRFDLMNAIIYQPMDFFQKNPTGNLMAYATNDIPAAREFIGPAIMYGANTITTFIFAFYFMFSLNVEITIISILPLPIITIATYFIGKKVHLASKEVQDKYADLTRVSQESISGARIVRAYNREAYESVLFGKTSKEYLRKNLKLARLQSMFMPALMVLVGFSLVLVLGFGGRQVIAGNASLGDLTQFFIYLTILIWPVAAIGWITNIVQRASASAARLGELFDKMPDNKQADSKLRKSIENSNISMENVSHAYEGNKNLVLKNINLEIPENQTLGIIGSVGSGKTSLVNLLPLLYKPSSGVVRIGGYSVDEIESRTLREAISFVPQDTFLFSMTIAENIKFSKPDASSEEIQAAAELAELHNEILTFEKGYDTMLGERGITLSGGQKQRTAIARALLRSPKILILDDALSAVDASTEEKILANLKSVVKNQTTIIISHRISSVRNADKIIALADGEIIEQGTHNELMELGGYYSEIFKKQQLEEEIAKM